MAGIRIYKKLAWLNELPADEAENVFRECSGSELWARRMASARPFPTLGHLFDGAAGAIGRQDPPANRELIEERLYGLLED